MGKKKAIACRECGAPLVRTTRYYPFCAKHLRFYRMRAVAASKGKSVPSLRELNDLLAQDMRCPVCDRRMNWFASDGRSTMITLQHDRSGPHRLICHACNSRHAQMPGDSFYDLPPEHKRCPKCSMAKPFSQFHKNYTDGRWKNLSQICKSCTAKRDRERAAVRRALHP